MKLFNNKGSCEFISYFSSTCLFIILSDNLQSLSCLNISSVNCCGRISSVGRALDWSVGGRGFDSRGRTNTQGLKITEK